MRALQGCVFTKDILAVAGSAAAWVQTMKGVFRFYPGNVHLLSLLTALHAPAAQGLQRSCRQVCLQQSVGSTRFLFCPCPVFLHWTVCLQLFKIQICTTSTFAMRICSLANWSYTLATYFTCSSTCSFVF